MKLLEKIINILKENVYPKYLDVTYEDIAKEIVAQNPKVIENDMTIFFDVDDTLVIWDSSKEFDDKKIKFDNYGFEVWLLPHEKHIEQMKRHAARGHKVIVWSAGGYQWAREVIYTLGLEKYVDVIMCKPQFYYDDLTPQEFMPISNRVYYDYRTKAEQTNSFVNDEDTDEGYGG